MIKTSIKKNPTKSEQTFLRVFDNMVIDYLNDLKKFGYDSYTGRNSRANCVGLLRALRLANVISDDMYSNILDCLYFTEVTV